MQDNLNEIKYEDSFELEEKLSKPFQRELAVKYVANPVFIHKLYHGTLKITDEKNNPFKENDYYQTGLKFHLVAPDVEGDDASLRIVDEFKEEKDLISLTSTVIKPGAKSGCKCLRVKTSIYLSDNDPRVKLTVDYTLINQSIKNAIKPYFNFTLHRAKKLAEHPDQTLRNLDLISKLQFDIFDANRVSQLPGNPLGVCTQITIPDSVAVTENMLHDDRFINALFSGVLTGESSKRLLENKSGTASTDTITLELANLNYKMEKIIEAIQFKIERRQDLLDVISIDKVSNFHQMRYRFTLDKVDGAPVLTVGLFYTRSNLLSAAHLVKKFSSYITDAVPDTDILLLVRARNLLDTAIAHTQNYFFDNLGICFKQGPAKIDSSHMQTMNQNC